MPINLSIFLLDKDISTPLYYQLKQLLLKLIKSGALIMGEQIPSEVELAQMLKISRSTVRQAVSELVAEGYLRRQKAKGTFVTKPKVDEDFFQILESFNIEMEKKGLKPFTRVLMLQRISGIKDINTRLGLDVSSLLLYLCRLRYVDEEPIVYLETYLPFERFADLLEEDFTEKSLYGEIELRYGTRIVRAERQIEAAAASTQEAGLLEVKRGSPVCLVKTVAYACDNVPVEYSVARYRGDRNKFSIEVIRK